MEQGQRSGKQPDSRVSEASEDFNTLYNGVQLTVPFYDASVAPSGSSYQSSYPSPQILTSDSIEQTRIARRNTDGSIVRPTVAGQVSYLPYTEPPQQIFPSATWNVSSSEDDLQNLTVLQQRERSAASSPGARELPEGRRSSQGTRQSRSNELDQMILRLREENPEMSWSSIAAQISAYLGETVQIPALQMRYNRFRKRLESRNLGDQELLRKALDYYDANKWEIIAEKMSDFGAERRWSAEDCERLWLKMRMDRLSPSRKRSANAEESGQTYV